MTGSFDETIALLERCYQLTAIERPEVGSKRKKVVHCEAYRRMVDEVVAEVLAEDGIYFDRA